VPESTFASPSVPSAVVDASHALFSPGAPHALVGVAVVDGLVDVDGPAPVEEWVGTEKAAIGMLDLLEMRSGLEFVEDYVDEQTSHCLEMLYGAGKDDMAGYAASRPLVHAPGSVWSYASGTTNIICRIVGRAIAPAARGDDARAATEQYLFERLFGPIGMTSAIPEFDPAGTFVGSSYVYASARDFARFGELYLRDGCAGDGTRLLPQGWVDHARTFVATDPDGGFDYGRHWWLWPDLPGAIAAHGYEGQYTLVVPDRELVVVHLGKSPVDARPPLLEQLRAIVHAFDP
jgi:CubicO group peptidase (beta-lactamase class C family)